MGRRNKGNQNDFCESAYLNDRTYKQYYNRLTELAITMFDWQGLPKSVDARFLELTLFTDGMAVFFKDEILGELALQTMIGGKLSVYRIPLHRKAYSANGFQKTLNEKNSVLIFNNYLHTNSMLDVEMFAQRLYDLDRSIDVNAKAQKTPVLIQCEESQRLTLKNLYMKYSGNEPFIFGDKSLNPNAFRAMKTDAPFVGDKLYDLKVQYWNEALTYLGISNTNIMKKERMISDEVIRNQGGVIASRYSRLEMRRQACEQINEMFGLKVSVNYREDYREVNDDGEVYSGETGGNNIDTMSTDTAVKEGGKE